MSLEIYIVTAPYYVERWLIVLIISHGRRIIYDFLKMAKELGLSIKHYDVCSGHKLFHCSMVEHADKYPICIDKIAQFVNESTNNKFNEGISNEPIYENPNETRTLAYKDPPVM